MAMVNYRKVKFGKQPCTPLQKNVDNIIATIDYNGRQIDGDTEDIISLGNLAQKWQAFGWEVLEMDGNDIEEVKKILEVAKNRTGKWEAKLSL